MATQEQTDTDRQTQEIQALKAIYDDVFIDSPQVKAWKGVASLNEFILRVNHPADHLASKFLFHLQVLLPKTYPSRVLPTIKVIKPVVGLSQLNVEQVTRAIRSEAESLKGGEMLFQLVTTCQEWLSREFPATVYRPAASSLAAAQDKRAFEEAEARELAEKDRLRIQQEEEERAAAQLQLEVQLTTEKRDAKIRLAKQKSREAPESWPTSDMPSESRGSVLDFEEHIAIADATFNTVILFQPHKSEYGIAYQAEPLFEIPQSKHLPPLEVLIITFDSDYYQSMQGWRKLDELVQVLRQLTQLRHPHLQSTYAVKLVRGKGRICPRLSILRDAGPNFTLHDMLRACDTLSLDKAMIYVRQVIEGLSILHDKSIVHRYLTAQHVGLDKEAISGMTSVKLLAPYYYSAIAALNRSNPFGLSIVAEPPWPDSWLSPEMVHSPLMIDPVRDIYHLAIVTLEMLGSLDVTRAYPLASPALKLIPNPWREVLVGMLDMKKKSTCQSVVDALNRGSSVTRTAGLASPIKLTTKAEESPGRAPSDTDTISAMIPRNARQGSRYRTDWEELEFLGSGGFGEVVKARNTLDGRIYAVKKIRLRPSDNDARIFREVNALARLSHKSIVRYYTTWIEISEGLESPALSRSDSGSEDRGIDNTIKTSSRTPDVFQIDLNDLTKPTSENESFPGIYFGDVSGTTHLSSDGYGSGSESESESSPPVRSRLRKRIPASTLYIQMEYVENLTLKERITSGLDEDEAWRLFHQLLDALVHMSSLGILHRDIKLNNIFIDANGDCKIGDFGLATSDIERHEPSTTSTFKAQNLEMTMDVGTRLYVAPELLRRNAKIGPKNHSKADMYSLGIVFFEMNFMFSTGAERIAVIERLRLNGDDLPATWESHRQRQRKIVNLLLLHDASSRPSALEMTQSPLLPPRLEDESLQSALRVLSKSDSPHHPLLLSLLFDRVQPQARTILYDRDWSHGDHVRLESVVTDRLTALFRLHGAVHHEPPIFLPATQTQTEDTSAAMFLDRQGDLVTLPRNALVSFARLAALTNLKRIKRYYIGNVYQLKPGGGHPQSVKAAVFDIITPSLSNGVEVAVAESMLLVAQVINEFPGLRDLSMEFKLFHPDFSDWVLSRVDEDRRMGFRTIMSSRGEFSQKKLELLRCGIPRALVDEVEMLTTSTNDLSELLAYVNKFGRAAEHLTTAIRSMKLTLELASALGFDQRVKIQALKLQQHRFKNGVAFEVSWGTRRTDILAAGGRYDYLFRSNGMPTAKASDTVRAVAVQIAIDKISNTLADYQSRIVESLVKEQRSFGFWSPKRCDAYVISHVPGQLELRLELVALLWAHGISADLMYESGIEDGTDATHDLCIKEGILFMVWTRPRTSKSQTGTGIKVVNTLTRVEHEVSRSELVPFLQHQLREQKRADGTAAGLDHGLRPIPIPRDFSNSENVQLALPSDRKHPKHNKKIMLDKAVKVVETVEQQFHTGTPLLAVHVAPPSFDALILHPDWWREGEPEALKLVLDAFPTPSTYPQQIREAIQKKRAEGVKYLLLLSLRDDRLHLLSLS